MVALKDLTANTLLLIEQVTNYKYVLIDCNSHYFHSFLVFKILICFFLLCILIIIFFLCYIILFSSVLVFDSEQLYVLILKFEMSSLNLNCTKNLKENKFNSIYLETYFFTI